MTNSRRLILHIDLDCFYCQVEQVRLGLSGERPLAVQQWNGLIAVNYAARKFQITRHLRVAEAKERCPQLQLVHVATYRLGTAEPDYFDRPDPRTHKVSLDPYRRASAKIFHIFKRFAKHVQKASVDEAYLDVTEEVEAKMRAMAGDMVDFGAPYPICWDGLGILLPGGSENAPLAENASPQNRLDSVQDFRLMIAAQMAREIRQAVFQELGYTCSAGVAHNKTLAKLCSAMNKPNQQTVLRESCVSQFMRDLPFQNIRFLGGKLGDQIEERLQVEKAGDVWPYTESQLKAMFGDGSGSWLYQIVRGQCNDEVVDCDLTKSMLAAKSLRPPARELANVKAWLEVLAHELYNRLRDDLELHDRWPKSLQLHYKSVSMKAERSRTTAMPPLTRVTSGTAILEATMQLVHREVDKSGVSLLLPCERISIGLSGFADTTGHHTSITSFFQPKSANVTTKKSTAVFATPKPVSTNNTRRTISNPSRAFSYVESPSVPPHFQDAWTMDLNGSAQKRAAKENLIPSTPIMDPSTPAESLFRDAAVLVSPSRSEGDILTVDLSERESHLSAEHANSPPIIYPCDRCGKTLYREDTIALQEHEDWHFAQDLLQQERKHAHQQLQQVPSSSSSSATTSGGDSLKRKPSGIMQQQPQGKKGAKKVAVKDGPLLKYFKK